MRPSPPRRVPPCAAFLLLACGDLATAGPDGVPPSVGSGSSGSSPRPGETSANTTDPPPDATNPLREPDAGSSGGGSDDDSGGSSSDTGDVPLCEPPVVGPGVVAPNPACVVPLQQGGYEPEIEWKWGGTKFCGPAVVAPTVDTNDNDRIDAGDRPLVFLYRQGDVVALWGDGSGVAWEAEGSYGVDGSGLALGDLDGDGWSELITVNNSVVCALDARDGAERWCSVHLSDITASLFNYPAVADMDGDGSAEVILGQRILDSDGAVIGVGKLGKGGTDWGDPVNTFGRLSAVVDLDGDGVQEVVTGNAAYDLDGVTLWQNGGLDGFVAVADFDLDGAGEIVKTTGLTVIGMETDGSEVWGPIEFIGQPGPVAIDDLDGDGVPEFVVGAKEQLVAMRWGGQVMWTAPVTDISGSAGPVLFDFEGDGYPEVVFADEISLRVLSGVDGALKLYTNSHLSDTTFETPIVADVDGDDQAEIVLGHCSGTAAIGAITVYGDAAGGWAPARRVWNQHTYHITNIGELGGVPDDYRSNWLGDGAFNSFRSGDTGQRPGEFHDLQAEIVEVCEADCAGGTLLLSARVRNAGTLAAPAGLAVSVRAGADGPVAGTRFTLAAVPPGQTGELLTFALDAAELADTAPAVTVDDAGLGDGQLYECDEQNNTAVWPAPVCAIL